MTAAAHHRAWRTLPVGRLEDVTGGGTCVVLAPHPDDESLGCGGLIAGCVQAGRMPLVVVLTDGAKSHPNSVAFPPARLRAVRAEEARRAVRCLGLPPDRLLLLDQPDGAAPQDGPAFEAMVRRIRQHAGGEATILAPWAGDPHCDHAAASAIAAATGLRHVAYPVWGWLLPPARDTGLPVAKGWRLDVTPHLPAKRRAIRCHRSQYGGLITDDPTGFRLPAALLSVFAAPFETFLLP